MGLLAYNIFYADGVWLGDYSNQYILLMGGAVAAVVGLFNKVSVGRMIEEVWENWKSIFIPIMILLLVGALAGTWLVSWYYSSNGVLWIASIKSKKYFYQHQLLLQRLFRLQQEVLGQLRQQ